MSHTSSIYWTVRHERCIALILSFPALTLTFVRTHTNRHCTLGDIWSIPALLHADAPNWQKHTSMTSDLSRTHRNKAPPTHMPCHLIIQIDTADAVGCQALVFSPGVTELIDKGFGWASQLADSIKLVNIKSAKLNKTLWRTYTEKTHHPSRQQWGHLHRLTPHLRLIAH